MLHIFHTLHTNHIYFISVLHNKTLIPLIFASSSMVRGKNSHLSRGIGEQSSDDEQYVSQSQTGLVGKSGQVLAACGRPAFSENVVNKKYNVCYRNHGAMLKTITSLTGDLLILDEQHELVQLWP